MKGYDTLQAPQVFHGKSDCKDEAFVMFSNELFAAVNNLFNGNEAKVMLTFLGIKGDGSFRASAEYMLKMTGIKDKSNYFRIRKKLIDDGYLDLKENCLFIDVDKIISNYKSLV